MAPTNNPPFTERRRIHVDGVVQGVGFRPFIYGLAARFELTGWVLNSSSGVDVEIQGASQKVEAFQAAIIAEAPPLARIDRVTSLPLDLNGFDTGFTIRHSAADGGVSLISPDVATCPDCLAEVRDPTNRRYRYPFTNCTNCGPRYTIICEMPYDRPSTTMVGFPMCPNCQAEYDDPANRRFHAQPNACPVCGPQVELITPGMKDPLSVKQPQVAERRPGGEVALDPIAQTATLLQRGAIVAIKGLGGFHLACDATNHEAVAALRERKHRPDKPFAVMMATLDAIRGHCYVSLEEANLLQSTAAPILLLYRKPESTLAPNVAPNNPSVGVMLPYTPLHYLLLRDAGRPLVMTSGNRSDLPVIINNEEALRDLADIADALLIHNRPIHMRCDDAVWWVDALAGEPDSARQPLRRSRGDAPFPVRLPWKTPAPILAVGGEMKNTFCLLREGDALLSQHIGEITTIETEDYFRETAAHLSRLFKATPAIIAHDLHPGYQTTDLAARLAGEHDAQLIGVQHHHAHIAACLAEHGRSHEVIGIALDGTGYGLDGTIWGGEVLIASVREFRRVAHLEALPLPGGEAAIHRTYRIAWGYLLAATGGIPDLPTLRVFPSRERTIVARQVERGVNAPLTSSCGRLFDAVAALTGVCPVATFEAQAAIALEHAARRADFEAAQPYPFTLDEGGVIRLGPMLAAVASDVQSGRGADQIAADFHRTVAAMFTEAAVQTRERTGPNTVALSGGSFQNRLLLHLLRDNLRAQGFEVLAHQQVPANDGGLSLGQAVIALHSQT